jgi:hypothetical protein
MINLNQQSCWRPDPCISASTHSKHHPANAKGGLGQAKYQEVKNVRNVSAQVFQTPLLFMKRLWKKRSILKKFRLKVNVRMWLLTPTQEINL